MSHLVIAGTGRAGTTFLVRWLAAKGQAVGRGSIDKRCGSGWEHDLRSSGLPYVVKDPWLWSYCDEVDPARIRVLVVPVRNLVDAAASRVNVLRKARSLRGGTVGLADGGVLLRVSVEDQADVLAVGFHELIRWAVHHDVPLRFIDFDRLNDDDYLDHQIGEFLL